ncbi:MAG: pgk [Parachlamydiales bacterium]|nr:pgk [Parachlamydiales bacterium]
MKLKISQLSLQNKRVLMRVDFNVPLNDDGSILDDSRIIAALPSIRYVLDHGGSVILMSHLGRPQGKKDPKASLAPCAQRLSALLNRPVAMAPDCIGIDVEGVAQRMKNGSVMLLENLRFHPGEEDPEKEPGFTKALARLGDIYVNDAFGTAHRAHASTALIAHFFPHKAAMGFLIEQELTHLEPLLKNPLRPFFAIIGGAKVASKAGVVKNLITKLDALFIGGGMAFPFLAAQKIPIGDSLCDPADIPIAEEILKIACQRKIKLYLPIDIVAAKEGAEPTVYLSGIPKGWKGMDIGPQTVRDWKKDLSKAATVFWNGPLGVFEKPPFDRGTLEIAQALAQGPATTIVGGGDSVAAIQRMGLADRFAHLSTGGGASLEFLEFGHLPGIDALSESL